MNKMCCFLNILEWPGPLRGMLAYVKYILSPKNPPIKLYNKFLPHIQREIYQKNTNIQNGRPFREIFKKKTLSLKTPSVAPNPISLNHIQSEIS